MKNNWKTTAAGVLTIVATLIAAALQYLHGQPINVAATVTGLTGGAGLIGAADSKA